MRRGTSKAFLALLAAACWSPVPAEFRLYAPLDRSQPPVVFVSSADLRAPIEASLERAGFAITQSAREASIFVAASVGGVRSSGTTCGPVRNVRYEVRQFGVVLAIGRARGPTGECPGNVFDEMSRKLAQGVLGESAAR